MSKKEKFAFLSGLMITSGVFGWLYEIIFYYINGGCKQIYLRGICFGPIIDIYVIGGLLIYLLNRKTKKWYLVFIKSGIICGSIEYLAGFLIYTLFNGKRSWNYNTEILNFGNINGFICFRSVMFFALSGLILMYVIVPLLKRILRGKYKVLIGNIFIVLFCIFMVDEIYNMLNVLKIIDTPCAGKIYRELGFKYW